MKASPQGASVVPTVAVIATSTPDPSGIAGTANPFIAAPQSGCASSPATM